MSKMNTEFIRAQFPGLSDDYILMDNAGGSQIASQVIDKVNEYFTTSYVQLGASYTTSRSATRRVSSAQDAVQLLVNAKHRSEVVIGSSTTMDLGNWQEQCLKIFRQVMKSL